MATVDLVKGGWDVNVELEERLAVSQRPADGHVKSAYWEDCTIITAGTIGCNEGAGTLKVGDILAIHTTPTLGYLVALGFAIESPVYGLELKIKTLDDALELDALKWRKATYDDKLERFNDASFDVADSIGNQRTWISGVAETNTAVYAHHTTAILLEVTAVPDNGNIEGLRIVSRMQYNQPVRPPAYLKCCGSTKINIMPDEPEPAPDPSN